MRPKRFPYWLRKRFVDDDKVKRLRSLLEKSVLNTVCRSARCPNLGECFRKNRATFLILGDTCTRSCRFCGVKKGLPEEVDKDEPRRIARAARAMGLDYIIITSVTRDDLADGGAGHFSSSIDEVRKGGEGIKIEVLTSDFKGKGDLLKTVLDRKVDVFAHNIETVPRLYNKLRPEADYKRSLNTLKEAHEFNPGLVVKSGIMVGLGENEEEVFEVMVDLRKAGCSVITIGQYLRPSKEQVEVSGFIHPSVFVRYGNKARELGFSGVSSGPFVRSSYGG